MIGKKHLLSIFTISVTLTSGLFLSPSFSNSVTKETTESWEISQAFKSPKRGAPSSTAGGGTRGTCQQDPEDAYYILLSPIGEVGLTVSEYPTFFVYVPEVPSRIVRFSILARVDENKEEPVTSLTFRSPRKSGIIALKFPATPKNSLKVNQIYRWEMEVVCDRTDRSGNVATEGFIQRVVPSQKLAADLEGKTDSDRAIVYADNGIWYESLAAAIKLRCDRPNDPEVQSNWEKLLKSVNLVDPSENSVDLNKIFKATLLNSCGSRNNPSSGK